MKRFTFPIILTLMSVAFAGDINTPQKNGVREVTPQVYPLDNHRYDLFFDASFLWWNVSATNSAYAHKSKAASNGNTTPAGQEIEQQTKESYEYCWNWNPGIRIGLGTVTCHDGWDIYVDWTNIYSSVVGKQSVNLLPTSQLQNADPGVWYLGTTYDFYGVSNILTEVQSKWAFLYNQLNLSWGRRYWVSPQVSYHPFFGVRGLWTRLRVDVHTKFEDANPENIDSDQSLQTQHIRNKQDFWGVGLACGFDTSWSFAKNWSLFTLNGVSLGYGKFSISRHFNVFGVTSTGNVSRDVSTDYDHNNIAALQTMIDLAAGLRWEMDFCDQAYLLTFDAGWEFHTLLNHSQIDRDLGSNRNFRNRAYTPLIGNIDMTGLTIRGKFQF